MTGPNPIPPSTLAPTQPVPPPAQQQAAQTSDPFGQDQYGPPPGTILAPTTTDSDDNGRIPEPDTPTDEYQLIKNLMSTLFCDNTFIDTDGGLTDYLRQDIREHGEIQVSDGDFREMLAKELKIPEKYISDEALDYYFGNQDGVLDENDVTSLARLKQRLEFLIPLMAAMEDGGGPNAIQLLRVEDIMIIEYGDNYLSGIDLDLESLYASRDPLFMSCLQAASRAYYSSASANAEGKAEVQKFLEDLEAGLDVRLPEEIQQPLFAAYWGKFRAELASREIDLPFDDLRDDPQLFNDFMNGIFANFIDGHSNPDNVQIVTNDLPEEINEETIKAALTAREDQLNRLEIARRQQNDMPAPNDQAAS